MIRFFSGVILMLISVSAFAISVTGTGFTPLGQIDTNEIVNTSATPNRNHVGGFFLLVSGSPRSDLGASCSSGKPYNNLSIPGTSYYGSYLAPGIFLVFYDSVITSVNNYVSVLPTETRVIKFDSNGQMDNGNKICIGEQRDGSHILYEAGKHEVSGILKYGIYVTPSAVSGANLNLSIYVYRAYSTVISINEPTQVNLIDCSVATPALIDFQDVPAGNTTPVIDHNSNISINCTGKAPSVSINYSMTSISETANNTSLMMKNAQNQLQGYVRGFIGDNASIDAGCNDAPSSMFFNQNPITLISNKPNNAAYSLDLKWVLCPIANPGLGEGTASTTLNIIWN